MLCQRLHAVDVQRRRHGRGCLLVLQTTTRDFARFGSGDGGEK
jgi:hypothetical protein